jgi:hypothetical protein
MSMPTGGKERESSKYRILLTAREIFVGAPTNRLARSVLRFASGLVYRWFDVKVYRKSTGDVTART